MKFKIEENELNRKKETIQKQHSLAVGLVDSYLESYQQEGEETEGYMELLCSLDKTIIGYLITGLRYAGLKDEKVHDCLEGLAFAYHTLDNGDAEKMANEFWEKGKEDESPRRDLERRRL